MKAIVVFTFFVAVNLKAKATEQEPDYLLFQNLTLDLRTGWGHPSPLQTYFFQNNLAYPFKVLSTGNYRGHIATWVIQNGRFYLKQITIGSKVYSPGKFDIKSLSISNAEPNMVFADWFSGIIECWKKDEKDNWKTLSHFYFQIRRGEIISMEEVTDDDFKKLSQISEDDTATDKDLIAKRNLISLNQNYVAYYYRLNESDCIQYNHRQCRLNATGLSPIYGYYSNEHLNWPYNWENPKKCGAPNCKWKITNDSLILTGVQLYSGLRFDSIDKENINLNVLFPSRANSDEVFADWVSGVYLIVFGIDTTYEFGAKEFRPKEYTFCRFGKGILKEVHPAPVNFYLKEVRRHFDPKLKKLMREYFATR